MPFKSKAQMKKFQMMVGTGEISPATYKHWKKSTKNISTLPDKVAMQNNDDNKMSTGERLMRYGMGSLGVGMMAAPITTAAAVKNVGLAGYPGITPDKMLTADQAKDYLKKVNLGNMGIIGADVDYDNFIKDYANKFKEVAFNKKQLQSGKIKPEYLSKIQNQGETLAHQLMGMMQSGNAAYDPVTNNILVGNKNAIPGDIFSHEVGHARNRFYKGDSAKGRFYEILMKKIPGINMVEETMAHVRGPSFKDVIKSKAGRARMGSALASYIPGNLMGAGILALGAGAGKYVYDSYKNNGSNNMEKSASKTPKFIRNMMSNTSRDALKRQTKKVQAMRSSIPSLSRPDIAGKQDIRPMPKDVSGTAMPAYYRKGEIKSAIAATPKPPERTFDMSSIETPTYMRKMARLLAANPQKVVSELVTAIGKAKPGMDRVRELKSAAGIAKKMNITNPRVFPGV